jgi:hypothetical protein
MQYCKEWIWKIFVHLSTLSYSVYRRAMILCPIALLCLGRDPKPLSISFNHCDVERPVLTINEISTV